MSEALRYDGRVTVVTGAGGGLGRAHALMFGARGAKVVVNDLGGSAHGDGKSSVAADKVVEEIRALGGEAVANYDSVEDGDKIIQTALDAFGRVDIVVNNAGILRDVSFAKMTEQDWDLIYRVHALGSFRVTHAAWPHLRKQNYGRIIMTASAAGLYGNFGQANYSMAKMGQVGFGRTLALEGAAKNIHVNVVVPIAGSRLLETVMSPEVVAGLKPEYVSALVGYLCHEGTEENGGIFEVGGGLITKLRWERTEGHNFRGRSYTPDDVAAKWNRIADFAHATHPATVGESAAPVFEAATNPSRGGNEFIDVDEALGADLPSVTSSYDERDVALYAIGVGAAHNPLDEKELPLVYELNSAGFHVLPTYGVLPAINTMLKMAQEGVTIPGFNFGLDRLLHGEQYTEIKRPLPPHARLEHKVKIKNIYDKGKNAVIVQTFTSTDAETGEELIYNELSLVVRGAGGWGGERGPASDENAPPDRKADAVIEEHIPVNQALLYRLSGDWNPLHVDPAFAKAFGFEKPILHGLCTFGYAGRHVIGAFCKNDPRRFKSIKVRFADTVFPGETLVTEMWKLSDTRIVFRVKVKERDKVVISNAAVEFYTEIPQAQVKAATPAQVTASVTVSAEPTTADIFAAIGKHLAVTKGLGDQTKTLFQFKLKDPDADWIIDLRSGDGSVSKGVAEKADCTLELSDADFLAMSTGKADAQKLYFGGKLKIAGNVMASQKLSFLQKIDPKLIGELAAARGGAATASVAAPTGPTTADIFAAIGKYLAATKGLGHQTKTLFQFRLKNPDADWIIDLRSGDGWVSKGVAEKADCTLELSDADFLAMSTGKADAQKLYFGGKLKIAGNVMASQKLTFLQKIDPKLIGELAAARGAAVADAALPSKAGEEISPAAPAHSGPIFAALAASLKSGQKSVNGFAGKVIQFNVHNPEANWVLDFSGSSPEVKSGRASEADVVFGLDDGDFAALVSGETPAQDLFQRGRLRVDGDVRLAHELNHLSQLRH